MNNIQLIECPRDAMQGWHSMIPTALKVAYETLLLKAGFHTIDFGSFVSAKAIPQMADTAEVIKIIANGERDSSLLAIVANVRGAEEALEWDAIDYLGFPFSLSETFQQRNTNAGMNAAFERVQQIQELCRKKNRRLVVYLSMGFGNPYGDAFSADLVLEWADKLVREGIGIISLADTVGIATPSEVRGITETIVRSFPQTVVGVHLHAAPGEWKEKVKAALDASCRRFDGAIMGFGGCPMAGNDLVGNIPMEKLVIFLEEQGFNTGVNKVVLAEAVQLAQQIFL